MYCRRPDRVSFVDFHCRYSTVPLSMCQYSVHDWRFVSSAVAQAAAPVGKWVVQQGFKAALGVLTSDSVKSRQRK